MNKLKTFITQFNLLLIFSIASLPSIARVVPSNLISDGMVLQQQAEVCLWGTAKPAAKVVVAPSWAKKKITAKTDSQGRWSISLATPGASHTPYEIRLSDPDTTVIIKNVLIGEVWMACGQSNMDMRLRGSYNCPVEGASETIATAAAHAIRVFTVPRHTSLHPQTDTKGGKWAVSSPATAPDFSAMGYYFAETLEQTLNVPVGIITVAAGGTYIEGWMDANWLKGFSTFRTDSASIMQIKRDYCRPVVFYNAMMHPVEPYTVRGFVWFQGESNVGQQGASYAQMMARMVKEWRARRHNEALPFYYGELSPFCYSGTQKDKAPFLREQQYRAQSLIPHSGMVGTSDVAASYECANVHFKNKRTVGQRLGWMALNETYGFKGIPCRGPEYDHMEALDNAVKLYFRYVERGFSRLCQIEGFEVAGEDRVFYPADSVLVDKRKNFITVASSAVDHPVAVRYGFHDFPNCNMGGTALLPMIPFRTDDWEE